MDDRANITDEGTDSANGCADPKQEGILAKAFAVLRLLGDKDNPLSLRQAIARAHREAENFRKWEESGAPINELVLRLSDGQEMAVEKKLEADVWGFSFTSKLFYGAVVHVYKKADREFSEVLLHSVKMDDLPPEGHMHEKEYRNGQKLTLDIQCGADGSFRVKVDYTKPERGLARAASSGWPVVIGSTVIALSQFLPRSVRRPNLALPQPSWSFAVILMVFVSLLIGLYAFQGGNRASNAPQGQPKNVEGHSRAATGGTKETKVIEDAPKVQPARGTSNKESEVSLSCESKVPSEEERKTPRRKAGDSDLARLRTRREKADARIAIYIKAFAENDVALSAALEDAFVRALKNSDRYDVYTDRDIAIPKDAYWIDLWFKPEDGCYGWILADLFVGENNKVGSYKRECHEYPRGQLLEEASRELVAEMTSRLDELKSDGRKAESSDEQ